MLTRLFAKRIETQKQPHQVGSFVQDQHTMKRDVDGIGLNNKEKWGLKRYLLFWYLGKRLDTNLDLFCEQCGESSEDKGIICIWPELKPLNHCDLIDVHFLQ